MSVSTFFRQVALCSLVAVIPSNEGCGKSTVLPPGLSSTMAAEPLTRAYSHNDYKQDVPLYHALNNGFIGVEADVFLVNGKLLVAHTAPEIDPNLTLESMYMDPLKELAERNHGHIYPKSDKSLLLMIDIKSGADDTYPAVNGVLKRYKAMMTSFSADERREGAVTAVITGHRPTEAQMESEPLRYASYEGRVPDLKGRFNPAFMPMVGSDWVDFFSWQGKGAMPENERAQLHDIVQQAHENGQRVRFWNTPEQDPAERAAVWKELVAASTDYINTDHLPELRAWIEQNDPSPKEAPALSKPARAPKAP